MSDKMIKLAAVGGGPKALALASKAYVLKSLGKAHVEVDIYDDSGIAANWDGENGFTDGEQPLGTPPDKDVGFPYNSPFGKEVDAAMLGYSWTSYLISIGKFGEYIDRGKPHPKHRHWAEYLRWVFNRSHANHVQHPVISISQNERAIEIAYNDDRQKKLAYYHGVLLTGPGEPLRIQESGHDWNERILDGKVFWQRLAVFRSLNAKKVAIIGGGETAASIVVYLAQHAPSLQIDLINRHGTIFTRGESYHENQLYTNPDRWHQLDEIEKEEFIRRTDRGVFSVKAKETIDQAPNVRVITGNVKDIKRRGSEVILNVERQEKIFPYHYDYVVVSVGFDTTSQLSLIADHLNPRLPRALLRREVDEHMRIPLGAGDSRKISNIHVPNLASFTQGPGFPNLSCLGALSDRILSAYIPNVGQD